MQTQRFWAKPDQFVASEVDGVEAPADEFKTTHIRGCSTSKLNYRIPTEPNKIKKELLKKEMKKGGTTLYKWSSLESFHRGNPKTRFGMHSKILTHYRLQNCYVVCF